MQIETRVHDRRSTDLPINSKVAVAIVDDPYSTIGEKLEVLRSVRNDPLADMLSRRVIDQAMFEAGRKWQRLHECTMIGPISAVDPSKEAVDGGRFPEPITDAQIDAFNELSKASRVLGEWGCALIQHLLAEGKTVGQIGAMYECGNARRMNFLSIRIRECLEDLGVLWGFVGRRNIRG